MFYGNVNNEYFEQQAQVMPKPLKDALIFLKGQDLAAHEAGVFPVELDGVAMRMQVMDLTTAPREKVRPEIHRKYIDLQFFVSGEGERHTFYVDNGKAETDSDELDGPRDILFYKAAAAPESGVLMTPGCYAVYFPWDVHLPGQNPGAEPVKYRKIVMKVPYAACV